MRNELAVLICFLTINSSLSQSCDYGSTGVTPVNDNLTLVWSDEFDDEGLVCEDNWHFQTQCLPGQLFCWANNEVQHYTDRQDNAFVENGVLKIVAKREDFNDQGQDLDYTSARLNSKFAFTYGRVDVRAKLPAELGTWPAIWMLGKNISEAGAVFAEEFGTTPWPACGEIDIMEQFGTNSGEKSIIHGTTHTPTGFGGGARGGNTSAPTSTTDFHIYSILWDENEIQFLLDGNVYYTYNPTNIDGFQNINNWPFDEPQFLILNIAMGGVLGGNIPGGFVDATMEIDYVRVYQNYDEDTSDNLPAPLVSAPTPAKTPENVLSIFSDSYSNISGVSYENEARADYADIITIEDNNTLRYIDINNQLVDFSSNPQDISTQDFFNIDYWTPNSDEITLALIDGSGNESLLALSIEQEAWVSVSAALGDFEGDADYNDITQIKFNGNGFVHMDNIYFSNESVELKQQSITFEPLDDISIDEESFMLEATATSGLDVVFSSFSTELEIDGSTVSLLSPGTVVIKAEQPGNDEYLPADPISHIFCVNPSKPTITESDNGNGIVLLSSSNVGNRWYLDGNLIGDQRSPMLAVNENGIYTLRVTVDGCFSPFSDELPVVITGVDQSKGNIQIFPNPTSSLIQINGAVEKSKLTLFDLKGKAYPIAFNYADDTFTANLESLGKGIYIVRISDSNQNLHFRIVLN